MKRSPSQLYLLASVLMFLAAAFNGVAGLVGVGAGNSSLAVAFLAIGAVFLTLSRVQQPGGDRPDDERE